jgi:hypothetical protein
MDSAIIASPWALHAALVRRAWLTGWRVWQERHDDIMEFNPRAFT